MSQRIRSQKLIAEINIAPFTDVILVLLIIFMAATPLILRSSVKIQLPKTSKMEIPPTQDLNVLIDASGEIFIDQVKYNLRIDRDLIRFKLSEIHKRTPEIAVVVNGDKNVKYDFVMNTINLATAVGFKHVVLATELSRGQ